MEQCIQVFDNSQFGTVRTAGSADNPLFCLADVCNAIGITNARNVKSRLDEEDVHLVDTPTNGGTQQITFVTESGLYDVIIRSDSEQAKPFRKWVTSVVLPAIRKTGSYSIQNLSRKELALMVIQAEEEKERLMIENKEQANVIEEQRPKVVFADAMLGSPDGISVNELSKILKKNGYDTGEIRLYEQLRREGYLCRNGRDYNLPTQKSMERKLFDIAKGTRSGKDGTIYQTRTTLVLPNGVDHFIKKYIKHEPNLFD